MARAFGQTTPAKVGVSSQFPGGVALLDEDGEPVRDAKRKPVKISAALWLDMNRPVQQMV